MATIVRRTSQDGHVSFLVRVRRKGTPAQTATFSKLSEAKKWAQMTEGAVLEGRHFQASEAKKHTLTDVITRYRREVLPNKRPSTIPDQIRQLCWWQTHLGHYLLTDITPAILVEHRTILTQGCANGTANRYLAVLSHACTMAVREWQWCEDNPVRKVSKPKEPRGEYVFSQRRKERGYWNPAKSAEILIHWIDSETQALLDRLIEGLPTVRLLLLVNYRPEYQHVWGSKTYYI